MTQDTRQPKGGTLALSPIPSGNTLSETERMIVDDGGHQEASVHLTFPIFQGGPFYRLQERLGLVRAGRRRLGLCVLYVVLFAWAPMAVLTALQGLAVGPTRLESFLMDFEVNVRLFVSVPVFLIAEAFCESQLRPVVQQFLMAGLVTQGARARFEALVRDTVRLSHSARAEAVLLGLAYLQCLLPLVFFLDLTEATWRLPVREGHHTLSLAGGWYFLVAFPLYAFLLWRWLWRVGLWWRFLWRTSRLDLHLTPVHRDAAGGLGFLSESLEAFAGFAFAVTATAAGGFADLVVYEGTSPLEYKWQVGGVVLFLLILITGPVMAFVGRLYEEKDRAMFRYGALASHQIQQVEQKWLSKETWDSDAEIDFRAVHQLGTSVAAVHDMWIIPLSKEDVLQLLLVAVLPFLPLLAVLIPLEEVLAILLKVLA